MFLSVNEKREKIRRGLTLGGIRDRYKPEADIIILNGFTSPHTTIPKDGDRIVLIKRGENVTPSEMEGLMAARHTPGVKDKLARCKVGIAGIGGLGSHVAIALARIGVGELVIVDHDVVEPSNLNRQLYRVDQLGLFKVEALSENIKMANPFVRVYAVNRTLDRENSRIIFSGCKVVIEALDDPSSKSMLIESLLTGLEDAYVVAGSGIAGYDTGNDIKTIRIGRLFVCGDLISEAREGVGLMAPRVMIAAGHQANQTVRILLGEGDDL